ncbi:MAG: right-handed parallel beta-helix repeat-containing protein [Mucilaginibacter polytrichastri]|nr:right-handed parallel beta-helix repeat-containing protein [Mucilaginibacter polytrichastri]
MKSIFVFTLIAGFYFAGVEFAHGREQSGMYTTSSPDSVWLAGQLAGIQDGGKIDLQGKTLQLNGFLLKKAITLKNGAIRQVDANTPCLIVDMRGKISPKFYALDGVSVLGVPGNISRNNMIDRNFAVLQIFAGQSEVALSNVSVSGAAKQGMYAEASGGSLSIEGCRFENNGNLVRDSILTDLDSRAFSVQVHNAAQFRQGDRVWLGDELNQVQSIDKNTNTLTFKNDGASRTVVARTPAQRHFSGQYVTRYKNFYNGAYIFGSGKSLKISNSKFNGNSHFGLFNCFEGPAEISSTIASGNGYIGLGNKTGKNFLFRDCVVSYNTNNGLDINQASNGSIKSCKAIQNGVDGLFIGQGDNVIIDSNIATGQKRIGILLNGSKPVGVSHAKVNYNQLSANRIGVCLTSVSFSQIQGNIIQDNGVGIKIMGQNNVQNPNELFVEDNTFQNNSDKDIFANVRGYRNGGKPGKLYIQKNGSGKGVSRALSNLKMLIYDK